MKRKVESWIRMGQKYLFREFGFYPLGWFSNYTQWSPCQGPQELCLDFLLIFQLEKPLVYLFSLALWKVSFKERNVWIKIHLKTIAPGSVVPFSTHYSNIIFGWVLNLKFAFFFFFWSLTGILLKACSVGLILDWYV